MTDTLVAAPRNLVGRTVVVTGGNGGIGLALARGVGRAGAAVGIWARNDEKNDAAVQLLADDGVSAFAVGCDVRHEEQISAAMSATIARFGKVDALFANAGVGGAEVRFVDLSLADWRDLMSVDVDGAFLSLREGARHMLERGEGGALVGVSSIVTRFGAARKAHYGAAKPAVEGLVRAIAVELASKGVRCNALAPGWTDTDLVAAGGSFGAANYDRFREATIHRTPVRRWAEPDDFGAVAAYLADPTLTFHTGDVLCVDGGYSIC